MTIKERITRIKLKTAQVYVALTSKQTPFLAKMVAVLTIGYALSPIDLIPDFIPILGYLDDLVILPFLIWVCIKLIPKPMWDSYEKKAKQIWSDGKPTRWYLAIPIILIWLFVAYLIIFKWILK